MWKCIIKSDFLSDMASLGMADKKLPSGHMMHIEGPLVIKTYEQYICISGEPMITLPHDEMKDFLQSIVDAAWDFGVQPKGVKDFESSNQSQKFHLDDMRSLVKKFTDAELK